MNFSQNTPPKALPIGVSTLESIISARLLILILSKKNYGAK
jgi:hypothetical protein